MAGLAPEVQAGAWQLISENTSGKGPDSHLIRGGWLVGAGVVLSSAPLSFDSSQLLRINHSFLFHRKNNGFFQQKGVNCMKKYKFYKYPVNFGQFL